MSLFTRVKNFFTFEKLSYKLASDHIKEQLNFYNFSYELDFKHALWFIFTVSCFITTLIGLLFLFGVSTVGISLITFFSSIIFTVILLVLIGDENKPYTTYFWYWIAMKLSKKYTIFNKIDNDLKKQIVDKNQLSNFVKNLDGEQEEIFAQLMAKHNFKSFNKYQLLKIALKQGFTDSLHEFKDEINSIVQYELKNYNKLHKNEIKIEKARKIISCLQHEQENIIVSKNNVYEIKEPVLINIEKN